MNACLGAPHTSRLSWGFFALLLFVLGMIPPAGAVTKANFDVQTTTYQWETVSSTVAGLNCDDCATQVNIGFPFPFAGVFFDKVYVSSNGILSFLAQNSVYTNPSLPTATVDLANSAIVAPYWDDLYPGRGGSVKSGVLGSAPNRRFVVSWESVPHYSAAGTYTFQVVLYETGEIKFQYGAGNANGSSATIGIEVANDDAIQYGYNQAVVTPGSTALLFRPQAYVQSVTQPCNALNQVLVRYSYPVDAVSAARKQNYSFTTSATPGLNVTDATLSADRYTVTLELNKTLQKGGAHQLEIKDVQTLSGRMINPNPTTRPVLGSAGLIGKYHSQWGIQGLVYTGPWIERNDAVVNFDWAQSIPDTLPRGDNFSVRWDGYLIPPESGSYVFQTRSDDGVRLWVNNQLVIDQWTSHPATDHTSASVQLTANTPVSIRLEYYEQTSSAVMILRWRRPSMTSNTFEVIPSSALSPCLPSNTAFDHLRIEHDGQGLTCQNESITLKACMDTACSSLYPQAVTVNLTSPASGWTPQSPVTLSGGSTTLSLSVNTAGTVTLGATATSPQAANPTRCFMGTQENCQMVFSACAGSFNCLEAREPLAGALPRDGRLYTKVAGKSFGFDVVALKTDGSQETGYVAQGGNPRTVTVELVDGNTGVCETTSPRLDPSAVQTITFTSTDQGRKSVAPITVNRAWKNVKCRVTDATQSPSKVSCSTDAFAIRPESFVSVTSSQATADTANGSSTTATPRLKAGSTPFDLTATAIAGYDGTPKINLNTVEAHGGAASRGQVGGSFVAAQASTGAATGAAFTYSEVGYFRFLTQGVYDDDFAGVDIGGGDCTQDFTNTLNSENKYGCKFGNSANTGWFGRFVPDRFALISSSLTPACVSGFSYMDQPFALAYKIEARNAADSKTANYHGGFAKATVSRVAENADNGQNIAARLQASILDPGWTQGEWNFSDTAFKFKRAVTPDGPFDQLDIGVSVNDNDGNITQLQALDMNATTSGHCSLVANGCNAKKINTQAARFRYGRLWAGTAHAYLETQNINTLLEAQYFNGTGFETNTLDSCTTLQVGEIRLDNNLESNQTDGNIQIGSGSTSFTSGFSGNFNVGALQLTFSAPGEGNSGFADITPLLTSRYPWLRYDWDGNGSQDDPRGRVSWGMYRGNTNVIYRRERWN